MKVEKREAEIRRKQIIEENETDIAALQDKLQQAKLDVNDKENELSKIDRERKKLEEIHSEKRAILHKAT